MVKPNSRVVVRIKKNWGKFIEGETFSGVVLPSKNNPESVQFRTFSGAVMAAMKLDNGKVIYLPWTRNYVEVIR